MIEVLHRISIVEIIVFVGGAVCGFMIMSRIIKYLLENHKQLTVAALIGIMLGSLRVPMQNIVMGDLFSLIICLVIGIIGMLIVLFVDNIVLRKSLKVPIIVLFVDTKFNYEII